MSTLSQFAGGSIISGYTTSATFSTNQTVTVPPGTKRIEALLCGGGGGGGGATTGGAAEGGAGGFGGCHLYELPVISTSIDITVGAGGAGGAGVTGLPGASGGTTKVVMLGTTYAAVGGGGGGCGVAGNNPNEALFGGCGGAATLANGGRPTPGAPPFSSRLIWSALDAYRTPNNVVKSFATYDSGSVWTVELPVGPGEVIMSGYTGIGYTFARGGASVQGYGYAGGGGKAGAPLNLATVWTLSGGAAGASSGGGGGMLAAGTAGNAGAGGNGGGGGAGAGYATNVAGGAGGNGFVIFRWYY